MAKSIPWSGFGCNRHAEPPAEAERPPAPARAVPVPGFRHSITDGVEAIWLQGVTGKRLIHGIASSSAVNTHKYALLARGCMARLPVPLLSEHASGPPIGEVFALRKTETQIYVRGRVWDEGEAADAAWGLIERGELSAFSGAAAPGAHVQGIVDGVTYYDRWWLKEVSLCRRGANPVCHFEIYRPGAP